MILKRFLTTSSVRPKQQASKMADILETYYQNGLTNYSSPKNKNLMKWLVQEYDQVFHHPDQIKVWINYLSLLKVYYVS